jgi:hypothetical protein
MKTRKLAQGEGAIVNGGCRRLGLLFVSVCADVDTEQERGEPGRVMVTGGEVRKRVGSHKEKEVNESGKVE